MTPQERALVDQLFDRLAQLENQQRDPDAVRAIAQGLAKAPGAIYPLVQTVLVQEEALRRADARIRELSGEDEAPQEGGFLDSMRSMFGGGEPQRRGSVPSVRSGFSREQDPRTAQAQQGGFGGSFLGTAAASAAGVIGGALLMNSIGSLFGGGQAHAAHGGGESNSPWDRGGSNSNSDLARDAGLNDVGRGNERAGFFDSGNDSDFGSDFGDFGGGDGGGE